jgi:hypothetical protein
MPETDSEVGPETARFQAFAAGRADDLPPAWHMRTSGRKIGILIAVAVVVAILAILFGELLVA